MRSIILCVVTILFTGLHAQEKFTVYFDSDIDTPNAESSRKLDMWLSENKEADISKIYAYADSVGKPEYNFQLSKRRLLSVNDRIAKAGIMFRQVTAQAFGEDESKNGALAGNRRVDIFYTNPQPASAPEPEKELTKAVTVAKLGEKLKLPGLNFYNNSGKVLPESEHVLDELLDIMKKNEKLVIEIQGHICCRPYDSDDISVIRAKAVYDFLVYNKISKKRLTYKGFGSSRPLYPLPEKTEEEQIANRRVEIEIIEN